MPHRHERCSLSVRASEHQVRIIDAGQVVATHDRHYGKGEQIGDPEQIDALRRAKQAGTGHHQQHQLHQRVAASERFLACSVERGHPLAASLKKLTLWLEQYGAASLQSAVEEALAQSCYHTDGVLQILEQQREQLQRPVPLGTRLSPNAHNHRPLKPASLAAYDQLHTHSNDEPEQGHESQTTNADETP